MKAEPDSYSSSLADSLLALATLVAMSAAIYTAFVYAPDDLVQGPVQRIFYLHLAMWVATYSAFVVVAVASVMYLRSRDMSWDRLGRCSAEIGLVFCSFGLTTGSIWGKPQWGSWWTWDPRLTLALVLWMIYAAYLLLRSLANDPNQGATLAAILGVSGLADIYLIHMAVQWWRGIHPAVIQNKGGGSGLQDPRMQITLVISMIAFFLLFVWLLRLRVQTAQLHDSVEDLREQLVHS